MSESLYLQRQTDRFLAAHPREAGWAVHEFSSVAAQQLSLNYLLACLRECNPAAITRCMAIPYVEAEAFLPTPTGVASEAETISGASGEAKACEWRGTIELIWSGHEIHCRMLTLALSRGCADIYFVATKSLAVFRDLLLVLNRYGRARRKGKREEIDIVNGANIAILPISWDEVILPANMVRDIKTNVEGFFAGQERYAHLGLPHRRGFLFAGPPGCGKTFTLKALASNTPVKFISVQGTADVNDAMLCRALELAEDCTPAVVLLEDLDRMVQAEGVSLSHFLNLLDGFKALNGVLVIATCNEPDKLDPALIHRPSRFDRVWRFDLPKYEQRLELLRRKGGPYFSASALETVARRSEGFSMAYVQEVVVNALLECAHDEVDPADDHILRSLDTLRMQRKEAAKPGGLMEVRETVGFCGNGKENGAN